MYLCAVQISVSYKEHCYVVLLCFDIEQVVKIQTQVVPPHTVVAKHYRNTLLLLGIFS